MKLWFNTTDAATEAASEESGNIITLSESFYREVDQHRIPVERTAQRTPPEPAPVSA
jgi:hypothetical protein